jgi:DNA-binding GntR family transcriptional regulator
MLRPITLQRPPSLAETVAHTIEEAIAVGQIQPGSPLVEAQLREQLDVSRSTLREAFRLLQDRGLIESIPHRGVVVTTLNERKAREIYELRMILESQAVRLTAERGGFSEEALHEIHAAFQAMSDLASKQGSAMEMIEADMAFHRVLCGYCDNSLLLSTLDGLRLHTRRFILFTKLYQSDLMTEAEMHRPIVEALDADPKNAAAVVWDHIREAGERLVLRMRELEQQASSQGAGK